MSHEKVLLVDDEKDFVEVLAMRLETREFDVDMVLSGEEALVKAGQRGYDAILLDLAMPGMDGIETLRRLREINPDSQVIVLTGRATVKQATEIMKLGALDLLEKPVEIEVLVEGISQAATNKFRLSEQRIAERTEEIIKRHGW